MIFQRNEGDGNTFAKRRSIMRIASDANNKSIKCLSIDIAVFKRSIDEFPQSGHFQVTHTKPNLSSIETHARALKT